MLIPMVCLILPKGDSNSWKNFFFSVSPPPYISGALSSHFESILLKFLVHPPYIYRAHYLHFWCILLTFMEQSNNINIYNFSV